MFENRSITRKGRWLILSNLSFSNRQESMWGGDLVICL